MMIEWEACISYAYHIYIPYSSEKPTSTSLVPRRRYRQSMHTLGIDFWKANDTSGSTKPCASIMSTSGPSPASHIHITPILNKPNRKPRAPHPSNNAYSSRRKLPLPLPARPPPSKLPTQSLKTLQGLRTRRDDTTHPGFGREVIFVTRSTGLGLLIGRCRSLVVDEGYANPVHRVCG